MLLSEFNQSHPSDLTRSLLQYAHIERWANEVAQQRPFGSIQSLMHFAEEKARTWTWDEILSALNTHPRIGEKKAQTALTEKEQRFSAHEQSTLGENEEILNAIFKGNVSYEKKYGFIFLIRAAGLNSEQILTALEYRLANDLETEKRIVHQQLLEIALLRLSKEIQND